MGLKSALINILSYALLLLVDCIVTQSLILLGGMVGIGAVAFRLYQLYRKQIRKEKAREKEKEVIYSSDATTYRPL